MPEPAHIGLDNPAFFGRLRQPAYRRPTNDTIRLRKHAPSRYNDDQIVEPPVTGSLAKVVEAPQPVWMQPLSRPDSETSATAPDAPALTTSEPIMLIKPQPFARPARPRQQPSNVLTRQFAAASERKRASREASRPRHSKPQLALMGMAGLVFIIGVTASLQTILTNHDAKAQVAALSKHVDNQAGADNQNSPLPSTTKPSASAFSNYVVAPDLARYIKIPRLGVYARVMQVGATNSGALGTPSNVYDTAWYTGSAKPGQPGATLIDGHVSSWTTHGVFYGIKILVGGDIIQIIRGDGTVLQYQVVKTQVYSSDNVDMRAAIMPITAGKPGLNLITCTGKVKSGTSQFNQRVVVFAQQI
jgi:sortase (surface protein transpeptidase)